MYTNLVVTDIGEQLDPVTADLVFGIKQVSADEIVTDNDADAYFAKVESGEELVDGIPTGLEFDYVKIIPGTGPLILYILYGPYIKSIMVLIRLMHGI